MCSEFSVLLIPQVETSPAQKAEEVRCFCGATVTCQTPDGFSGLWLQCDRCRYWQHGDCVGHPTTAPKGTLGRSPQVEGD